MADFFTLFTKPQQFLLLQAYADEIMTEEELMNFVMQETTDQRFVFISDQRVYVVTPNVSLDDFSKVLLKKEQVQVFEAEEAITLQTSTETLTLLLEDQKDLPGLLADIQYLLSR